MKEFSTVLTILLGWLLGLLTPGIAERIRRPYRRRDLMQAVVDEMLGLQHTMAVVAWEVRLRSANVPNAFLDKVLPIIEGYHGPDRNGDIIDQLKNWRSLPEDQRAAFERTMRQPNVGMSLVQYAIPLFAAQIADLAICSVAFRKSVLHIRYHLDLFNQLVPYTQAILEATFNKPSAEDLKALLTNREQAYRDAGRRAEIIMQAIGELQNRYNSAR